MTQVQALKQVEVCRIMSVKYYNTNDGYTDVPNLVPDKDAFEENV